MEPVTPEQLRRAACLHGHEYGKRCLRAAADRIEELEEALAREASLLIRVTEVGDDLA